MKDAPVHHLSIEISFAATRDATYLLGTMEIHQYSINISEVCCHGEMDKDGTGQTGYLLVDFAKPQGQSLHRSTSTHKNEPVAMRSAISRISTKYRSHLKRIRKTILKNQEIQKKKLD